MRNWIFLLVLTLNLIFSFAIIILYPNDRITKTDFLPNFNSSITSSLQLYSMWLYLWLIVSSSSFVASSALFLLISTCLIMLGKLWENLRKNEINDNFSELRHKISQNKLKRFLEAFDNWTEFYNFVPNIAATFKTTILMSQIKSYLYDKKRSLKFQCQIFPI